MAPVRDQLDDAAFERLVSALAMVIGWEALIVLQDLRGLAAAEQQEVILWTAGAIIQAALPASADQPPAGGGSPRR